MAMFVFVDPANLNEVFDELSGIIIDDFDVITVRRNDYYEVNSYAGSIFYFRGQDFTYDNEGYLVSGTVTGISVDYGIEGYPWFEFLEVADLNLDAANLLSLMRAGNLAAFVGALTAGADVMIGADYDDVLEGGGGADWMIGGLGDDIYYVNDSSDRIYEKPDEGFDIAYVSTDFVYSPSNFYFGGLGVERIVMLGDADLRVTALVDHILGNDGDNVLGWGRRLEGGLGNDTYTNFAGSEIIERPGEGIDTVQIYGGFDARGTEIENIVILGPSGSSGTTRAVGNDYDNVITGSDNGHDFLNGGKGADTMTGGKGNDIYGVDNIGDRVIELAGGGVDMVRSTITFTLTEHLENLTILGTAQVNLIGNAGANTLIGNDRGNVILGHGGRDLMTGKGGADRFDFRQVSDSPWAAFDRITDLTVQDRIDLSRIDADTTRAGDQAFSLVSAFTGRAGQLTLTYFASGNFTQLAADVDGDGRGDFRVILNGDQTAFTNFAL